MNLTDLQIALANNANVAAFLKSIRLGEGTSDDAGYNRIVGGGSFTDMSRHPNQRVWIPKYQVWSTAAGAFQIIFPTWEGLVSQYGFPDFEPPSQDCMAVALIAEKNALDMVIAGDLAGAVDACSSIWASLPGSQAGQRTEAFDAVQTCYLNNGGQIETT